jgi:hypothetical protein
MSHNDDSDSDIDYDNNNNDNLKKVNYKLCGRHLLLVESVDPTNPGYISKEEISKAKQADVDVVYVTRESMWTTLQTIDDYKTKWLSINLLFHGAADSTDSSISIFGVKMSMNRNIMMEDQNVRDIQKYIKALSRYTTDSIYIYCCAIGFADGLKELCSKLHKKCELREGIFVSTDVTGNGLGENWNVEWGSKYGFLTPKLNDNNIQHAVKDLFRDIKALTFSLQYNAKEIVAAKKAATKVAAAKAAAEKAKKPATKPAKKK